MIAQRYTVSARVRADLPLDEEGAPPPAVTVLAAFEESPEALDAAEWVDPANDGARSADKTAKRSFDARARRWSLLEFDAQKSGEASTLLTALVGGENPVGGWIAMFCGDADKPRLPAIQPRHSTRSLD